MAGGGSGAVCDDDWSLANAKVPCRELQCGGGCRGEVQGDIWLDNVQCSGRETSVFQCDHNPLGDSNCVHGEDAGVMCSGRSHSVPELLALNSSAPFFSSQEKAWLNHFGFIQTYWRPLASPLIFLLVLHSLSHSLLVVVFRVDSQTEMKVGDSQASCGQQQQQQNDSQYHTLCVV